MRNCRSSRELHTAGEPREAIKEAAEGETKGRTRENKFGAEEEEEEGDGDIEEEESIEDRVVMEREKRREKRRGNMTNKV